MKRSRLKKKSSSPSATLKDKIQDALRRNVMKRDGGCILREERGCGNEVGMEGVVFQADHLIERSNSATYADSRLVVCVCKGCHGWKHFKKSNHDQYNDMVKRVLPQSRLDLWEKCERDSWKPKRTSAMDWGVALAVLDQEYREMGGELSPVE